MMNVLHFQVFNEKQMNPNSMGVVTDSSGNHAQAVAYAASKSLRTGVWCDGDSLVLMKACTVGIDTIIL